MAVCEDCGNIAFEERINNYTRKLEYKDLTRPEKLMLFQHKLPDTT